MKIKFFLMIILLPFVFGCGASLLRAKIVPPKGFIYTNYKAPLEVNFKEANIGNVDGSTESHYIWEPILGTSWGYGDAGIAAVAKESNIKNVEYVDYEYFSILGIYEEFEVIPRGTSGN